MKPRDLRKDLVRLRDEYRGRVSRLRGRPANGIERRLLDMEASVLGACEQDLDDLINGKEHPSARRG